MEHKILLSLCFICFAISLSAQETITISGTILDEKKQALVAATVAAKGTAFGTTTDNAGKYSLKVPSAASVLIISYIGYENKEIPIVSGAGDQVINVELVPTQIGLNQVVVSVSRRKEKVLDAPASITVIGQEKLESNIVTTPVDELKGVSGVDIIRTGLISSDVVIRGFNNIFSGTALNVIDDRIGSVPSLRVNAYQLVPTSSLDYQNIEVVRGPASALYGPNASSGVISIRTKSPLDQDKKFETTVAMTSGFIVLDKSYKQYNNGSLISGNIVNPEIRHSGKLFNGKFGYKISAGYFQGKDYPNYDSREPYTGDSLLFGTARNGEVFQPDTVKKYTHVVNGQTVLDSAHLDIRRFNKDFNIRKWNSDAQIDFKPAKDITVVLSGGISSSHNIELTGLGSALAGGDNGGWIYWYVQAKFRWKNLFIQYFLDASDAGDTYLIPQLSAASRQTYGSTSPPTPYDVQLLIDKSKMHVAQIQHSWSPTRKLNFVYGVDLQLTRPNTEGTINGRLEPIDKLDQVGGYLQGNYDVLKWLTFVAAGRVDYNSIIKNVAASPRAAVVFKVAENQDIRITYNRAFDSPNTLNQFLDLSNGLIPNGINVRGIGNPFGWNYSYDNTGGIQFKTAPWGGSTSGGQWISYNGNAGNAPYLDSLINYLSQTFAKTSAFHGSVPFAESIISQIFTGISGPNGSVANATKLSVDYANFAQTGNLQSSLQNASMFQNLKKINNQYTQTLELGYKGFLFHKLSLQVDGYWNRISNYVSALTSASGAVMLNANSYLGGYDYTHNRIDTSGLLYKNLYNSNGTPNFLNQLLTSALDGTPSLQNHSIVPSISGTAWDELEVLTYQFPMGTITPNSKYVNSDYILTYKNLGRLDLLGVDLSLQYNVYEGNRHLVQAGGTFDWVDKDQLVLSTGESVPLNAPKVKFSLTYDHTLKKSGFGYGLSFRYQMPYDAASSIYMGHVNATYLLDARISYRPKFYKGLLLSLIVNDVADYQWSSFPGAPLMGTQVYVKAQVTF